MDSVDTRRFGTDFVVPTIVFCSLTFTHLGVSEYLSVQFCACVLILLLCIKPLVRMPGIVAIGCSIALLYAFLANVADQDAHFYLKTLRFSLALTLLLVIRYSSLLNDFRLLNKIALERSIFVSTVVHSILALLQLTDTFGANTAIFDVPASWYSLDYGTLFSDRRSELAAVGYFIRPYGFFSEPSSLSLFGLIIFHLGVSLDSKRLRVAGPACVILSGALSGAIVFLAYFLIHRQKNSGNSFGLLRLIPIALLGVITTVAVTMLSFGRFEDIQVGGDVSTAIRFTEPLRILQSMMSSGDWFGLSERSIEERLSSEYDRVFDNWFFNQFMWFGILGGLTLALPLVSFPRSLWLLVALCMPVNGDLLYYDRFIWFVLALLCWKFEVFDKVNNLSRSHND